MAILTHKMGGATWGTMLFLINIIYYFNYIAYWVCMARSNLFLFVLYMSWILAHSSLSTGVENDTIEEDAATGD